MLTADANQMAGALKCRLAKLQSLKKAQSRNINIDVVFDTSPLYWRNRAPRLLGVPGRCQGRPGRTCRVQPTYARLERLSLRKRQSAVASPSRFHLIKQTSSSKIPSRSDARMYYVSRGLVWLGACSFEFSTAFHSSMLASPLLSVLSPASSRSPRH